MENGKYKHTPGPWIVDSANYDGLSLPIRAVVDTGETLVIAEALNDVRELERVYKANAALVASAPDLLDALREASRALTLIDPLAAHHDAKMIDNALAKARGGQ